MNAIKHLKLVLSHKRRVFRLCVKAGIPIQGLFHDLSKFSYQEFSESIKYFSGTGSPINNARKQNGYSKAWISHKSKNKHHYEYWYDLESDGTIIPVKMPYKYAIEMVCDMIAASQTYNKDWKIEMLFDYWEQRKDKVKMHEDTKKFLYDVFLDFRLNGEKALSKKYTKKHYK